MTTIADLLQEVPSSVADEVKEVVERARAAVREALRAECRLSLGGGAGEDGDPLARAFVNIRVDAALPTSLPKVIIPESLARLLVLAPHIDTLRALARGGVALFLAERAMRELPGRMPHDMDDGGHLPLICEWAGEVMSMLDSTSPAKLLLDVDHDVLGSYSFVAGAHGADDTAHGTASIYWAPIGLVSRWIGSRLEDLTIVVLAHELAHAYTHLGADIDGRRWSHRGFGQAKPELAECLAQYYTMRTLNRLRRRFPGAIECFNRLLPLQHEVYRGHQSWAPHVSPEAVRWAMLDVRNEEHTTLAAFMRCLDQAEFRRDDER